ncbi:hypothetical protein EVG20_g3252 [Dentipellis fragilis]|uniref:RRM domain-containing protein n=1 Tax=Dentipellis fragilis TaxID=205917 RepID=A0A4Y9Z2V9_9AGAM|nr:hypothetical protein EVG20_g3252 [Dentipellis fragilis]
MNVVREINKINELELDLGISGASWHDEYKDSAYVFVGGLDFDLTEGDVITIMSQYGEVMDINMPRSKETGKTRGFAFVMYEDQRSTILAVDNLNGAKVLEKTLRVDHVKNYKQGRTKGEDGEWIEPEEQSLNAKPEILAADAESESSGSDAPDIDPDDPMRDYLLQKWRDEKKEKKAKKSKSKGKHKDQTPEERRARKERKRQKKARRGAVLRPSTAVVRTIAPYHLKVATAEETMMTMARNPHDEVLLDHHLLVEVATALTVGKGGQTDIARRKSKGNMINAFKACTYVVAQVVPEMHLSPWTTNFTRKELTSASEL